MPFRKNSAKDSYGRLTKYWSATDADILPIYESNYFGTGADGALSTSGNVSLAATEDGDIVVKNYTNLTINSGHTLTTDNRCRGLLLFVDGNLVVDGTISMTARGCKANPATAGTDGDTPVAPGDGNGVGANGIRFPFLTAGVTTDTLAAAEFQGCGTALYNLIAEFPKLSGGTGHKIIAIARTGAAGGAAVTGVGAAGNNGAAGATNQTGGGASGGHFSGTNHAGTAGTCFSGGTASGSSHVSHATTAPAAYGGAGGNGVQAGAGNPAGTRTGTASIAAQNGTGGLLIIICSGNITGTGTIVSKGMNGGSNAAAAQQEGGGATGGGQIVVVRGGTDATVTKNADGGVGGAGNAHNGGSGGAGTIQSLQVKA